MRLLYRLIPTLTSNPLFQLEARRVRWGVDEATLLRATGRWLILIGGGLVLLWLVPMLLGLIGNPIEDAWASGFDFIAWLIGLSFLASLALDFICISTALVSIHGEIVAGRWDLLRLSLLRISEIVRAKYGVAQLRVWRATMILVSARFAVMVMLVIYVFGLILLNTTSLWGISAGDWITFLVFMLAGAVMGGLYVVEPLWRMRALTALGVAISARAEHHSSAMLLGVGAMVAFWMAEILLVFVLVLGISIIFVPLGMLEASFRVLVCTPTALITVLVVAVWGFFSIIQTWSLRRAERWLMRFG